MISKGFWAKAQNEKPEFFIINDAIISKLCILGEEEEPCFEGAHITNVQFSFEDSFQQQLFSMMKEIKEILSEGGASMNLEEKDMLEVVEEEVIEETVVEETVVVEEEETVIEETLEFAEEKEEEEKKCPECGKPLDECECEEEPKAEHSYSLEEIPEYVDLLARYSDLEVRHQEALDEIESLKTENGELVTFKLAAERKDKVAMVDSFYMLSDEDKKDVLDNIDQYSIDDIEAKLSIICVRNKVSFDLDEEKKDEPTTYNLNSGEIYCGYQNKDNLETKAWDPKNIELKIHVKGDTRAFLAFGIDLETNEIIIFNQLKDDDARVVRAEDLKIILKYLDPTFLELNMGRVISYRGEVVTTPEEAAIIFADDVKPAENQKVVHSWEVEKLVSISTGGTLN